MFRGAVFSGHGVYRRHFFTVGLIFSQLTRSQAVARIADRTATQHLWGSHDIIGHVAILYPMCHFLLMVLWN